MTERYCNIMSGRSRSNFSGTLLLCTGCLILSLALLSACIDREEVLPRNVIAVNELGYHPDYHKLAIATVETDSEEVFQLIDAETRQLVFEAPIRETLKGDRLTGETVSELDFSSVERPGIYQLSVPGQKYTSSPFKISYTVYNTAFLTAMESFYYQRCGTEVDNNTPWRHPVCHINDAPFYDRPGHTMDVSGGWHDAGDYGKFVVTSAVSAAYQLYLFEKKQDQLESVSLNIPAEDMELPDVLRETKWGLEWLLKMQREDGGVYFKVSEKRWTGEYLPHRDPDTRYIFEVSSTATADVAAVSALAARLFAPYNKKFAERLEKASQKAWVFLECHPDIVPPGGFKNPVDVEGGEYGDVRDLDERLWASVELYRLTGQEKYHTWFLKHYRQQGGPQSPPVSWQNVAGFAWNSYLHLPDGDHDPNATGFITEQLVSYADLLLQRMENNGYRIILAKDEFYWGSNSVVAGYAFDLLQAYEVTGNYSYKTAALEQLHYILGRNPMRISYVTGVGHHSVQNPYHQFSMRLNHDKPVPGMLVGGPNNHHHLNGVQLSPYAAKSYEDNSRNYMVNETAINYTASFLYLAGYFADFEILRNSSVEIEELPVSVLLNNQTGQIQGESSNNRHPKGN